MKSGWFASAHRAAADVWSLFWLLGQKRADDDCVQANDRGRGEPRTHLARLLEASAQDSVRIEAVGAGYRWREALKARGYRWDAHPLRKVWWRELAPREVEAERLWFNRTGLPAPRLVPITASERHR
jgi:DNA polymerase-3 subunit epsilon